MVNNKNKQIPGNAKKREETIHCYIVKRKRKGKGKVNSKAQSGAANCKRNTEGLYRKKRQNVDLTDLFKEDKQQNRKEENGD